MQAPTTSCGRPRRFIGFASAMRAFISGGHPLVRSVSFALGRTRFARTLGAHVPAKPSVSALSAALAMAYGRSIALGRHDPTEETLMIDPPSPFAIRSPTRTLRRNGPRAFVAWTLS